MTGIAAQTGMSAVTKVVVDPRRAGRGQVLVIFAGALLLLMMMTALVVDVSWYWVNSLRVQRAADAAALAGAVMLPNKKTQAYTLAYEEASKNGYPVGAGVTVTPLQDPSNDRRLAVTIHAPIGTFFMRVIGIESIGVTRTSKAEFTLPVPMGSPQNYYGVGFYEGRVATTTPSRATRTRRTRRSRCQVASGPTRIEPSRTTTTTRPRPRTTTASNGPRSTSRA